jgi:hypothetical protein
MTKQPDKIKFKAWYDKNGKLFVEMSSETLFAAMPEYHEQLKRLLAIKGGRFVFDEDELTIVDGKRRLEFERLLKLLEEK